MIEAISDALKQVLYRYWRFKDNAYFNILEQIYRKDNELLPNFIGVPDAGGYLIPNFSNPSLKSYQGKEIAFINSYQFAIYWLSGVSARAMGDAADGQYHFVLSQLNLKIPITLTLDKLDNYINITSINTKETVSKATHLKGCFLPYAFIEAELKHLLNQHLIQHLQLTPTGASIV